jgi:integrase
MKGRGRHPQNALSAAFVTKVKKPGLYCDGGGLYLCVDENRAKRWELNLVVQGKRRYIGLGGVTTVSLAEAREEARRLRGIRQRGGDPLAERRKAKAPSFEQAAREVYAAHAPSWKNPQHGQHWIGSLERYVFPIFGTLRVDEITASDVLAALQPIWLEKAETGSRVLQRVNVIFDWAKAKGMRAGDNPCDGVRKVLPKQKDAVEHHAALPYAQVPAFLEVLRTDERAGLSTRLALEFLVLTIARSSEVLLATWDEVDTQQAGVWTIPALRMKAGREHRVPLSARCLQILEQARTIAHGAYIFPGAKAGRPLSGWVLLRTLERLQVACTVHGFRSSARDWMSEAVSFPHEVCEAALAHTIQNKVEAAYRRGDLFARRRELMDAWSAFATSPAGQVIPLRA